MFTQRFVDGDMNYASMIVYCDHLIKPTLQ